MQHFDWSPDDHVRKLAHKIWQFESLVNRLSEKNPIVEANLNKVKTASRASTTVFSSESSVGSDFGECDDNGILPKLSEASLSDKLPSKPINSSSFSNLSETTFGDQERAETLAMLRSQRVNASDRQKTNLDAQIRKIEQSPAGEMDIRALQATDYCDTALSQLPDKDDEVAAQLVKLTQSVIDILWIQYLSACGNDKPTAIKEADLQRVLMTLLHVSYRPPLCTEALTSLNRLALFDRCIVVVWNV
jgi:hypothetical protein